MIQRGKIYWFNLDPTIGSEIKKTRPCLVVSNDQANRYSPVVTIVPVSSSAPARTYPFEVALDAEQGGLKKPSVLKANQIRTVDKKRVSQPALGSGLDASTMADVAKAIKIHLDIED